MAGFDNGTVAGGIFAQAKQFGSILRGLGPPPPSTGVLGDVYLDAQTFQLFGKRDDEGTDPWGRYFFIVPADYRATLKWFASSAPQNDIGVAGDYCLLWSGFSNYGVRPSIYGPKTASGWPENGDGINLALDPAYVGYALPVGINDEGVPLAYSTSTQIVVTGVSDEYILAVPVPLGVGTPVSQLGVQSQPVNVAVTLNPLYTAIDEHAV